MNTAPVRETRPWSVFLIFLRLGLTSFGGPVAHLGYFRQEFVTRRRWLSEERYADLIALCQFLPGPASSQVGLAIGLSRGGYAGALAAWAGFTLPSAFILVLFALGISSYGDALSPGILHGLKVVAVAVVAQAVWKMGNKLCPDAPRILLMALAAAAVLFAPTPATQILVILGAGTVGLLLFKAPAPESEVEPSTAIGRRAGVIWLTIFFVLLIGLPLLVQVSSGAQVFSTGATVSILDAFYRSGSLVFGGGHVVLPLLQAEVVHPGWVGNEAFLAGYGATQAVPGPLFTFSAFLGASINTVASPWAGAATALVAIYLPSFLLIFGAFPFWERLRRNGLMRSALTGVNAAVVGILLAALYQPVWTSAIQAPQDVGLAGLALLALMRWNLPAWLVVLGTGLGGWVLATLF